MALRGNREDTGEVPGSPPIFLEIWKSLGNNTKNQGFGQSSLPKWVLYIIEFIWVWEFPLNCHHKMIPSQIHFFFSGPIFDPKKVPGPKCQPKIQKSDPGLKNPPLGMKNQKMRAEKTCRNQYSELQTEPYSATYGQNPV